MVDDNARAGEELAKAWLQGKSELIDFSRISSRA